MTNPEQPPVASPQLPPQPQPPVPQSPAPQSPAPQGPPGRHAPRPATLAAVIAAALTVVTAVILIAFVWPVTSSEPKDLRLLIAPASALGQVQQQLQASPAGSALDLAAVADENAARDGLQRREAVGAIVFGPDGPTVLKAGASSPLVSQLLDQLAANLKAGATGVPVGTAVDVVPPPAGDPRGMGFGTGVIPMTLAGIFTGAVFGFRLRPKGIRLAGVFATAALIGLSFAGLLHAFGVLGGSYLVEAGVIALTVAAVAVVTAVLVGLLGPPAMAIVVGIMVLLGIPLSGINSAPEVLPAFWGSLGQGLPAGAGGSLLRTVSFFPQAPIDPGLWVLLGWIAVGLLLALVPGRARQAAGAPQHAAQASSDPAGSSSSAVPTPINDGSSIDFSSGRNRNTLST